MDCHNSTASFSHKTHQEVKQWSAKLHGKKGDCLPRGFVSELPNAVVDAPFCPSYLCCLMIYWASGPFALRFEFEPRTSSVYVIYRIFNLFLFLKLFVLISVLKMFHVKNVFKFRSVKMSFHFSY